MADVEQNTNVENNAAEKKEPAAESAAPPVEEVKPEQPAPAETKPDEPAAEGGDQAKEGATGGAKAEVGDKQPDSTTDGTGGGSADDIPYFWNTPCKRYRVTKEAVRDVKSTAAILVYEKEAPPQDGAETLELVKQHGLKHGDILAFSDERDSKSFILCRDMEKEEYKWLENPDDSNAGYLTIPAVILKRCSDGVTKYSSVIRDSVAINLHVSPKDSFLRKKFGEGDIPETWDFDIHFSYGELEEVYVRTPGAEWEAFDADETTLEDIKEFFEAGRHYTAEFTVTVELEGEQLEEYKQKYGDEDDKYAWLQALPEIPPTWKVEKGESSGADDEYCWEWMFSGPEEDEEEVRESVAHFLRGFEHKFH